MKNRRDILIILGAGMPKFGNKNQSLLKESLFNTTLLDWQLNMAKNIFDDVIYVAGFNAEELELNYSKLKIIVNEDWENTGPVASLDKVDFIDDVVYTVIYGDLSFTEFPSSLLADEDNQIRFAFNNNLSESRIDSQLKTIDSKEKVIIDENIPLRFGYKCPMLPITYEFCGAISARGRIISKSLAKCKEMVEDSGKYMLSNLCEIQRLHGVNFLPIDVKNTCFEINSQKDLSRKVLGTKAETLKRLQNVLYKSVILDQKVIRQKDWSFCSDDSVKSVVQKFSGQKLVVRSSAISEDSFESAFAGVFDSFLGVSANEIEVREAISNVFSSYQCENDNNQVLIQPMLRDVRISGVIFTKSLDYGAPYYIINFDQTSGLTDTVTAGDKAELETLKIARHKSNFDIAYSAQWQIDLIESVKEIESLIKLDELDIEFAVDFSGTIYILQVRPIVSAMSESSVTDKMVEKRIKKALKLYKSEEEEEYLGKPIYAQMPDWNPAEIIGARSDFLSYSIYKAIITDHIWSLQRFENGNCDLRGVHLIQSICGKPYVFLNASLLSFIPKGLDAPLKEKILLCALNRYKSNLNLHDKVEFEIIPTCYTLDTKKWHDIYVVSGPLTDIEFNEWMMQLKTTTKIQIGRINEYIKMSKQFDSDFDLIKKSNCSQIIKIKRILFLLQNKGTLSFAHLARCGFISVSILNSLIELNPEIKGLIHDFQASIKTVSSRLSSDIAKVRDMLISQKDFLEEYGHLRPSSYDIYSLSYKDNFDNLIMSGTVNSTNNKNEIDFRSDLSFLKDISYELDISSNEMSEFITKSIQWREESKFIFSKGLSYILDSLKQINPHGLYTSGDIKYLGLSELLSILDNDLSKKACFDLASSRKTTSLIDKKIELPQVICNQIDFEYFFVGVNEINFIGTKAIIASLKDLSDYAGTQMDLNGCIALIESADPGYDWLFSHNISGLITQYGGANSHMAIRAVEYDIPAAIGVGELHRKRIEEFNVVELDCVNKILRGVSCE